MLNLCDAFYPCDKKRQLQNGNFSEGLAEWKMRVQTGSDPSANWFWQTTAASPLNNFILPFPAPEKGDHPYALFETKSGTRASAILYQEFTIPFDRPILTFNWYALCGCSQTSLIERPSMNLNSAPNFQFRTDLLCPKAIPPLADSSELFTSTSTKNVIKTLISPVISGASQVDSSLSKVIGGFNHADFDLCKYAGKRVVLAFRVVSALSASAGDTVLVGIGNVKFHSRKLKRFSSGFILPMNGRSVG